MAQLLQMFSKSKKPQKSNTLRFLLLKLVLRDLHPHQLHLFLEDPLAQACAALFRGPGQLYVTVKTTMRLVLHKQRVSVCLISNIMTM